MPPSLRDRLLGRGGPGTAAPPENPPTANGNGAASANTAPPAVVDPKVRVQPATTSAPLAQATPAEVSKIDPRSVRAAEVRLSAVDQLKLELHRKLVERLDLAALERITDEALLTTQIRNAVIEFIRAEQAPLSATEREEIVEQIIYEVTGLGPIEPLFRDGSISDILVNGPKDVYIERRGKLSRTNIAFRDNAHLLTVIDRIVSRVGRRVDESSPMVDARLADGSRVNAIIPPLALDGPVLSIRRFGAELTARDLVAKGAMTDQMLALLAGCVLARLNILISGGTGSGKTTLLNALSSFIPTVERVVTIEDAAELRLQQDHVVRLETRPPNSEGRGEVMARDLVKNALRMRPDRIILGECRGEEAFDMLQAMNTGHEGSMATVHANTPRDAITRLEQMIGMAGLPMTVASIRGQIANAVQLVVQLSRQSDGKRKVTSIAEVTGMEGDIIQMQEIFKFVRTGTKPDGTVEGHFAATGVRPRFLAHLQTQGIKIPGSYFDPSNPL
jgi:pilus assembly protein CpaF